MEKIHTTYGIGTAIVLIVYFLVTKLLDLHQYPILSAANGLIIGAGIFFSLKKFKASVDYFKYQDGFQVGLFTGGIATIVFSIFMAVYIFQMDTEFAKAVLDTWHLNLNKGSLILIMSFVITGFSTTFVLTLAFMQLLKESWNPKGK